MSSNFTTSYVSYNETHDRIPPEHFILYHITMVIVKWGYAIVILFGTIGNILAFVVLMHRRMRNTSVNFYLSLLACADTGVLYISAFRTWMTAITGYNFLHVSDAGCKLFMFMFVVFIHISAWLVVAVSVDRFVAVWFPFKSLTMCNVRRARIVGVVGFVVLVITNCHILWNYQLATSGHRVKCDTKGDVFMKEVFPWLKLATYSCVPFVLVLVLNVCILTKVITSNRGISGSAGDERHSSARASQEGRVTTMLLTVSFTWLALTAPFTLWTFLARDSADRYEREKTMLAKAVCFLLMYINHGVNFYLYCLTGKKFRQELRSICCRSAKSQRASNQTLSRTLRSSVHTTSYYRQ